MSAKISILGSLRIAGALVIDENRTEFPADAVIGTLVIKDQALYAYILVGGIPSWYPMVKAPSVYTHEQSGAADEWVITHNLGATDIWYQIQDADGNLMTPAGYTAIDANSFSLQFGEPVAGKVLVLSEVGQGSNGSGAPATPLEQYHYVTYPDLLAPHVGKLRWSPPVNVALKKLVMQADGTTPTDVVVHILMNGQRLFDDAAILPADANKADFTIYDQVVTPNDYITFDILAGGVTDFSLRLDFSTTLPV